MVEREEGGLEEDREGQRKVRGEMVQSMIHMYT